MPAQDRLRHDDRRETVEELAAEGDAAHGKPTAIVEGQPQPAAAELRLQNTVLLAKVVEHALPVAVQPSGKQDGEGANERRHEMRERDGTT